MNITFWTYSKILSFVFSFFSLFFVCLFVSWGGGGGGGGKMDITWTYIDNNYDCEQMQQNECWVLIGNVSSENINSTNYKSSKQSPPC